MATIRWRELSLNWWGGFQGRKDDIILYILIGISFISKRKILQEMAILSKWENIFVVQRHGQTGCIPSAIEWMLRYRGIQGIDFSNFQERFDLDFQNQRLGINSFGSVTNAINQIYPNLEFEPKPFPKWHGKEKLSFIEDLIARGKPCLISISLHPFGACHIVPVIEIDENIVKVLWMHDPNIKGQVGIFLRPHLEFIHDNWIGGDDVLYLKEA